MDAKHRLFKFKASCTCEKYSEIALDMLISFTKHVDGVIMILTIGDEN